MVYDIWTEIVKSPSCHYSVLISGSRIRQAIYRDTYWASQWRCSMNLTLSTNNTNLAHQLGHPSPILLNYTPVITACGRCVRRAQISYETQEFVKRMPTKIPVYFFKRKVGLAWARSAGPLVTKISNDLKRWFFSLSHETHWNKIILKLSQSFDKFNQIISILCDHRASFFNILCESRQQ